jgi:hypothetical protein
MSKSITNEEYREIVTETAILQLENQKKTKELIDFFLANKEAFICDCKGEEK